jgi:hypothetical protein
VTKESIRFPLRIHLEKNKEIDEAVYHLNNESLQKVSKHQFIMEAIEEKLKQLQGAI